MSVLMTHMTLWNCHSKIGSVFKQTYTESNISNKCYKHTRDSPTSCGPYSRTCCPCAIKGVYSPTYTTPCACTLCNLSVNESMGHAPHIFLHGGDVEDVYISEVSTKKPQSQMPTCVALPRVHGMSARGTGTFMLGRTSIVCGVHLFSVAVYSVSSGHSKRHEWFMKGNPVESMTAPTGREQGVHAP